MEAMSRDWRWLWLWDKPKEQPLPVPTHYGLSRPDQEPLAHTARFWVPFIGGSDAYWCQSHWGVVSIRHAREQAKCPLCHAPVVFVATVMRGAKEE